MYNTQMAEVQQLAYTRVHELAMYVTMDVPWGECVLIFMYHFENFLCHWWVWILFHFFPYKLIAIFFVLLQVETALKGCSLIYDVYAAFAAAVTTASATLWAELDINKLMELTDEFALRMKKMKALKAQITYINLEAKLKGFQDSLPLFQVTSLNLPAK